MYSSSTFCRGIFLFRSFFDLNYLSARLDHLPAHLDLMERSFTAE